MAFTGAPVESVPVPWPFMPPFTYTVTLLAPAAARPRVCTPPAFRTRLPEPAVKALTLTVAPAVPPAVLKFQLETPLVKLTLPTPLTRSAPSLTSAAPSRKFTVPPRSERVRGAPM